MLLRRASVTLAFLLVLFLAYTAWWAAAAWQIRQGIEGWLEAERAAGGSIRQGALRIDGFPGDIRITAEEVQLDRADGSRLLAARLEAWAAPWNPTRIDIALPGRSTVGLVDGTGLALARAEGRITLHANLSLASLGVQGAQATLTLPGLPAPVLVDMVRLDLTRPAEPPLDHRTVAAVIALDGGGVLLPEVPAGGLDPKLDRLGLELAWLGPLPDMVTGASLDAWSRAGGTVELRRLGIAGSGITADGDATLALDRDLQPVGAGTLRLTGVDRLLDVLVAAGTIPANQLPLIRRGLDVVMQTSGGSGLTLPVTVQNRTLFLGPAKLARLPPILWDAAERTP